MTAMWDQIFAERMAELRRARQMSQSDLARQLTERGLPYHQQTVAKIERGTRKVRLAEACEIAAELGVDLASMLTDSPKVDDHIRRIAALQRGIAAARRALDGVE